MHSRVLVAIVSINLILEVPFAFCKMMQRFLHAFHFLLPLKSFAVFTTNIACDGVQNTLKAILSGYLSLLFQFQQV